MTKQFERAKDTERRVLAVFKDLAKNHLPAKTNREMAAHLGLTVSEMAAANKRLRRQNLIQVEKRGWRRRITIVAGVDTPRLRTDWTKAPDVGVKSSKPIRPQPNRSRESDRKCLVCGKMFLSQHPGERICANDKSKSKVDLWGESYVASL